LKIECPRRELFEAISTANAAASGRSPIPILQNLKLDSENGNLRILGCDGEMWVERQVPCMIEDGGAVCVQSKLISDLISKLPDGDISLETSDSQGMLLKQGASEYRMLTLDPADFPEPPAYGGDGELKLPMGELRAAIDSVSFAVSTDNHRPILTGVLFQYDGTTLTLVATDTHRLAVKTLNKPGIGASLTAVVPERALKAIKNLPLADSDEVTIVFGAGRLGVEAGGAKIVSQLLNGSYPNWERVVPTESTRSWSMEVDQLKELVGRVMILARENANRVRMIGKQDTVLLEAQSEERGKAKEELPSISNNGEIEIAFNGKFIQDALSAIQGQGVRVEMTENTRPAVFRPTEDESYYCVVMPMALF
jgi:DNA polymerase-3 subunit beta